MKHGDSTAASEHVLAGFLLLLASVLMPVAASAQRTAAGAVGLSVPASEMLLPAPKLYRPLGGPFRGRAPLPFNLPEKADLVVESIRLAAGPQLPLADEPSPEPPVAGIRLILDDPELDSGSPERYRLRIDEDHITIVSPSGVGLLNGLRTLAQLALEPPILRCEIMDWPDYTSRGAHLCYHLIRETTAYNTPNFEALIEQIDRLASLKVNTVLLELESMFPYESHPLITCAIAFTPDQIQAIRRRCELHHIEIIPLVQCLGHAYNVLVHDEYAYFRELPDHIQQYCPTNPDVIKLYMQFVDEYLAVFPGTRRWHVGGDESRMLGRCPRCRQKVDKDGVSKLYVDHVGAIARRLLEKGLKPMLWSDMLEHHPEAMDLLPDGLAIVYWNYDLPTWGRGYAAPLFLKRGWPVIGAVGVRFGASGTELSVHYPHALRGIESFGARFFVDGGREIIATNWMKGSPHESTDYGLAYLAAIAWNLQTSRGDFQERYARLTFGLDDPGVCLLYESLSLWLPYAEPVQNHMPDRLDRFNLSGLRFGSKWHSYSDPAREPEVLRDLHHGLVTSQHALDILEQMRPHVIRNKRAFMMLAMSATCIRAKAQLSLLTHEGHRLSRDEKLDMAALARWLDAVPSAVEDWDRAKELHHALLSESGFPPCVSFLSELMFEPAELEFLRKITMKLTQEFQTRREAVSP